jgi:8-oxo-dGTP pyrophosphatase MutT (NUDIX family)
VTRKVLAYITRARGGETQLLVFGHVDFPDAGMQVPKGTVEPGESLESAARRELREETGLAMLDGLEYIGQITQTAFGAAEEWNFFSLRADGIIANYETWTHRVQGRGEDEGMLFGYYWVPLSPGLELAGRQHEGLQFLNSASAKTHAH